MIGIELVYNLALLVALSILSGFIVEYWRDRRYGALLQGVLFGGIAIMGMLNPLNFSEGIIFDGRSTVISIAALFFGPIAAAVSGGMAIVCRILQGGVGAFTGVLVILSSAAIGIVFHRRHSNKSTPISVTHLLFFGLLVHVAMLLLMYTLPFDKAIQTMQQVGLLILTIYPLATVLIGKILSDAVSRNRLMRELLESEKRYRLIAENTADYIVVRDLSLKSVYVSPSVKKVKGFSPEEFLALNLDQIMTPASFALVRQAWAEEEVLEKSGTADPYRKRVLVLEEYCKDGSSRFVEKTLSYIRDHTGEPTGILSVSRDITDRKRTEEALRASEEKFHKAFHASPDTLVITRAADDHIVEFNDEFLRMAGCAKEEVLNSSTIALNMWADPAERDRVVAELREKGRVRDRETVFRVKNGALIDCLYSGEMILLRGEPHVLSIVRDISERKRMEYALRESEHSLRSTIDGLSAHIAVLDENGTIMLTNKAWRNFAENNGLPAGKVSEGANYLRVCDSAAGEHSREAAPFAQGIRDVLAGKNERFSMEYPCNSPDKIRWFIGRVTVFPGEGPRRVVIAHENYTKRKLLELEREELIKALQDKNDEMESMLYASSHDLRTPLVSIQGFNGLIQNSIKDLTTLMDKDRPIEDICAEARPIITEKLPTASAYIGKSAEKMNRLVDGILRLSRLGRATHTPGSIDMNELIRETLDALKFQTQETRAVVAVGDLPSCWGDRREIEQAFSNLVDNAIKYRDPKRPLTITVSGTAMGDRVTYTVADTGIGIKKGHQDQIWGLFSRLDPGGNIPGEGLGLALVKRIVQRNRGKVWVESEYGKGTVFYIVLPHDRTKNKGGVT